MKRKISERLLAFAILWLMSSAIFAETVTLDLVKSGSSQYSIVYASGNTTSKSNAEKLAAAIKTKTGCNIPVKTDATAATQYEIVLGPTNSRDGHDEMKATLGKFSYRIAVFGKKLIITASDANHMVVALKRFEVAIVNSTILAGSDFLKFSNTNDQFANFEQTQATLRSIISNSFGYSITLTKVCQQHKEGDIYVAQGAGTDGTHIYLCNRTSGDTYAKIYKFDMNGNKVASSSQFAAHHANDLTVDSKNGRILVVNGSGATKELSVVNTSNLSVSSSKITIGRGVGALAYCPERDMYAASQGGNCIFYMGADLSYNSTYNYTRSTSTEGSSGYVAQGMGCDVDYVYFPMSKTGTNNILVAYDWNGNFKKKIVINSTLESESMFECDGKYYVNFHRSSTGAELYRLNITLVY